MKMDEYLILNSEGLIPGPNESEEAFDRRVQDVKQSFDASIGIPRHQWTWAQEQLRALYDFSPAWCSAVYSSKKLAPWQPAATWIDVNRIYTIQIRPARWVKWFVNVDELLAHEAVHAARAAFNEPKTEEMFAYLTSCSKWRRIIGPLFRHPKEALFFMTVLVLGSCLQVFEPWGSVCYFAASILCLGYSVRLLQMRRCLEKAAAHLQPLLKDPSKVRAVLFRMSDQEVFEASRGRIPAGEDLRSRIIRSAYFK